MNLIEVNDKKTGRLFWKVPFNIYKNDPNWIAQLDADIDKVFDPKKNKYFRHGTAIRWILKNDQGELIGRVAAFVNEKTAVKGDFPVGGMGFFECINDREAAFFLFDTAKKWLEDKGMEAMDGPINFGERDQWWGLLVDIFDPPAYGLNYNPPYYQAFFEDYGFKVYFEQYTFVRIFEDRLDDKYYAKAKKLTDDPNYRFESLNIKQIDKYTEDFRTIYNKSWGRHEGFKPMAKEQAQNIMKKLKPVMDPDVIFFGYYKNDPIAFFIMLPELNQIFRHLNGRLNWLGKLKFLWHKKRGTCNALYGVAFGVVPEFQGKGIEGGLVVKCSTVVQPPDKYLSMEMLWIGDFNPKMIHIAESAGGKKNRTFFTYRKLFDPERPFERHPII